MRFWGGRHDEATALRKQSDALRRESEELRRQLLDTAARLEVFVHALTAEVERVQESREGEDDGES